MMPTEFDNPYAFFMTPAGLPVTGKPAVCCIHHRQQAHLNAFDIIRLTAREFNDIDDATLRQYIEIYRPLVSRKQFGRVYELALAYFVAHKLKVSGLGNNPFGVMNPFTVGFGIGSVSEGGSSVSFGMNQSSNSAPDAEFAATVYGLQYLTLRRMRIIAIHITGSFDGELTFPWMYGMVM